MLLVVPPGSRMSVAELQDAARDAGGLRWAADRATRAELGGARGARAGSVAGRGGGARRAGGRGGARGRLPRRGVAGSGCGWSGRRWAGARDASGALVTLGHLDARRVPFARELDGGPRLMGAMDALVLEGAPERVDAAARAARILDARNRSDAIDVPPLFDAFDTGEVDPSEVARIVSDLFEGGARPGRRFFELLADERNQALLVLALPKRMEDVRALVPRARRILACGEPENAMLLESAVRWSDGAVGVGGDARGLLAGESVAVLLDANADGVPDRRAGWHCARRVGRAVGGGRARGPVGGVRRGGRGVERARRVDDRRATHPRRRRSGWTRAAARSARRPSGWRRTWPATVSPACAALVRLRLALPKRAVTRVRLDLRDHGRVEVLLRASDLLDGRRALEPDLRAAALPPPEVSPYPGRA